jgi:hypothetical protein
MKNVRISLWISTCFLLAACGTTTKPSSQGLQGQCEDDDADGDAEVEDCETEETPTGICAAAESIDDACEAVHGDQADVCAPFDTLDEACEAGAELGCAEAEALDDECEAVFGEDAPECDQSDALDEACEGSDACTADDQCDADETCVDGACE